MIKKLTSLSLIIVMLCAFCTNVAAYRPGPRTAELDLKAYEALNNAASDEDGLTIEAGGTALYIFTLPFNSTSVSFECAGKGGDIELKIDNEIYDICANSENEFIFDTPIRVGDRKVEITAVNKIVINSIVFNKVDDPIGGSSAVKIYPNLSDYQTAIQTAVLICENAPYIYINGGRRYINYDNVREVPKYFNGSLYLPALTLARALGYYIEELPEKDYMLLRKDDNEYTFCNGTGRRQIGSNPREEISDLRVKFENNTYLPVRYFAEEAGEYVYYKDGMIAIDYNNYAKKILNTSSYYNQTLKNFTQNAVKVQHKTYYVAQTPDASDENDGSEQYPFRTLNKAAAVAKAGDTVKIKSGIYRETLVPKNQGSITEPIVFAADEGADVTISATEEISGFANYKDGMVVRTLNWDLGKGRNQIFYNGSCLTEARYPNIELDENGMQDAYGMPVSPLFISHGDLKAALNDDKRIVSDTLLRETEEDYWAGSTIVSAHGEAWTLGTGTVASSKQGELTIKDTTERWWFGVTASRFPNFAYLTGNIKCVDIPGEWFIGDNILFIIPPEGETAGTLKLEVKKRQLAVDLKDAAYVQLIGIKTFGGGIRMNDSQMCVLKECDMKYISHATSLSNGREMQWEGAWDPNSSDNSQTRGEAGIYISGDSDAVIDCNIQYSAGTGLSLMGTYTYVENNVISDCAYGGGSAGCINIDTEPWKGKEQPRGGFGIYNNTLKNANRSIFTQSGYENWLWSGGQTSWIPWEFAYNELSGANIASTDLGIFYIWGANNGIEELKTRVHHNVCYTTQDESAPSILGGLYCDNYIVFTEVYDNLVFANNNSAYDTTIYVQPGFGETRSYAEEWDNIQLKGVNAMEELGVNSYPKAKPFMTGAKISGKEFLLNYKMYNTDGLYEYTAGDAVLGEGVILQDGTAWFSGDDQWIEFRDVDFSEKRNTLNIIYKGDCYNTGDYVEVLMGDSMENATVMGMNLSVSGLTTKDGNHTYFYQVENPKKQNVYIRVSDFKSLGIEKIYLTETAEPESNYLIYYESGHAAKIYAGEYTDTYKAPTAEGAIGTRQEFKLEKEHMGINGTWAGNWVRYKDVTLTKDATEFFITAATDGQWSGNTVEVKIGGIDSETIASTTIEGNSWYNFQKYNAKLNNQLPAGTYDIYVLFGKEGASSNVYTLGFE